MTQSQLKVNFTDNEASSKPRDIPPSGEYVCAIVDGSRETVKPNRKNTGKPYWKVRFVIQDGTYQGSSISSTIMLFDGALFSLSQLMSALGFDINAGEFNVPNIDELFGRTVIVKGYKRPATTQSTPDGTIEIPERFEIKGYKPAPEKGSANTGSNILP